MQITIDTRHDSKEEIQKAIKMLMSLTGEVYTNDEQLASRNVFEQPETDMGGMMSLFDSPPVEQEEKSEPQKMEFY